MAQFKSNKDADQGFIGGILLEFGIMVGTSHTVLGLLFAMFGALIYLMTKCDI